MQVVRIIMITAMALLASCRSGITGSTPARCKQYIQWFEDPRNGMTQSKTWGNKFISCRLSNSNYEELSMVVNKPGCEETIKALREKNRHGKPELSFIVKVNDESGELKKDLEKAPALVNYLQVEMKKDFGLLYHNDTLKPLFYHFENNLDVAPQVCFVVGFDLPKVTGDLTLLFDDKIITFQPQSFVFKSTNIKRIPKI